MAIKKFPISQERLEEIIKEYPTPFHIYDEKAIRANLRRFKKAFDWAPEFREYFAVKATPKFLVFYRLCKKKEQVQTVLLYQNYYLQMRQVYM